MLKKIILSSLFFIADFAFAQKVTITWGQESKKDLTYYSFVKGSQNDLIKLCFEEENRTILPVITRYNNKIEEQTVNNVTVDQDGVKFDNFLSIKDRLYFFTNIYDKKTKATSFYCQPLNIKTFNRDGKNINLGTFESIKKSEQSTIEYFLSKDSSKVLVMGLSPYEKNAAEKYYLGVYDHNINKIWDTTVELPYKDKYINILSTIVTNDGKVGVVLKHYDNETTDENIRKNGKKAPSYKTKLLLYSQGESKPHEFILNTGDKFVHTLSVAEEDGKNLTLFGLYQVKAEGNVNGYFIAKINKDTKQISLSNINPFPEALLTLVKKDKQGSDKEKDGGLGDNFKFVKLITRENGDKDYILEYRYSAVVTGSSTYGGSYSYRMFIYGDIIDINIKANGSTVMARIPKYQIAVNDSKFVGFEALPYKDKLLLVYNDDNKNLEKKLSEKPEELKLGKDNATLAMATIDANGNVNRSILINSKQTKFTSAMNVSFAISNNQIALYASKGGLFTKAKDMVGLLELK